MKQEIIHKEQIDDFGREIALLGIKEDIPKQAVFLFSTLFAQTSVYHGKTTRWPNN